MGKKLSLGYFHELGSSLGFTLISTDYINSHQKMEWLCKNNHVFLSSGNSIKACKVCPTCFFNAKKSNLETDKEIHKIINDRREHFKNSGLIQYDYLSKFSDIIIKLVDLKYENQLIAKMLGSTLNGVLYWRRKNNIKRQAPKNFLVKYKDELKKESVGSFADLGKKYGSKGATVWQFFKENNLAKKSTDEYKNRDKYNLKNRINELQELLNSGLKLKVMARQLNIKYDHLYNFINKEIKKGTLKMLDIKKTKRVNNPKTNRLTQKTFSDNKKADGYKNKTFKFLSPGLQALYTEKKESYCKNHGLINDAQFLEILLNNL